MSEKINGLTKEEFNKLPREGQERTVLSLLNGIEKAVGSLVVDCVKTGELEYEKGIDMRLSFKGPLDKMRKSCSHHPSQQPDTPRQGEEQDADDETA